MVFFILSSSLCHLSFSAASQCCKEKLHPKLWLGVIRLQNSGHKKYIHTYIYICVCVCVCMHKHMHMHKSKSKSVPKRALKIFFSWFNEFVVFLGALQVNLKLWGADTNLMHSLHMICSCLKLFGLWNILIKKKWWWAILRDKLCHLLHTFCFCFACLLSVF